MAKLYFLNRYLSSLNNTEQQCLDYGCYQDVNNSVYKNDYFDNTDDQDVLLKNSPLVVIPVDAQLSDRTNSDRLLYDVTYDNCGTSSFVMFCNEPFGSEWEDTSENFCEDTKCEVDTYDSGFQDGDCYISSATGVAFWQRIEIPKEEYTFKRSFIDVFWLPESVIRALNCEAMSQNLIRIVFQAVHDRIDCEDKYLTVEDIDDNFKNRDKYLTVEDIDDHFKNRDWSSSNDQDFDEIGFGDCGSTTDECSVRSLDESFIEEIGRIHIEGSQLKRKLFTSMDEPSYCFESISIASLNLEGIGLTNRTPLDFVNGGHGIVNPQFQEFQKQNSRGRRRGRSKRNAIKESSGVNYCSIFIIKCLSESVISRAAAILNL